MVVKQFVAVAVLIIGTVMFFNLYDRYEPYGPELLSDPGFTDGFEKWQISGRGVAELTGNGTVMLRAATPDKGVAVRQYLPDPMRHRLVRLRGELRAQNIQLGEQSWHSGRLVLVSFDTNQRMIAGPHVVVNLQGTQGWKTYQAVFRIPQNAVEVRVSLQIIGATGELAARNFSLHEVQQRSHYNLFRSVGLVLWVFMMGWLSLTWVSQLRLDLPHFVLALAFLSIVIGVLMPGALKLDMEGEVSTIFAYFNWLNSDVSRLMENDPTKISDIGHFLLFTLLAMATSWAYPTQKRCYLLVSLICLAAISEVLQFFVEGRLPLVTDMLVDVAGLLVGIGLFESLRTIKKQFLYYSEDN
jgi:VanZ family protein